MGNIIDVCLGREAFSLSTEQCFANLKLTFIGIILICLSPSECISMEHRVVSFVDLTQLHVTAL
jgi:hypothetical protein